MMKITVHSLHDFQVSIGSVVLHLSDYKLIGSCLSYEQGTADGTSSVTACYPKNTKLTLRGKLAPSVCPAEAAAALDAVLHSGETRTVFLGDLICTDAKLIGYTFEEGADCPELSVTFLIRSLCLKEDDNAPDAPDAPAV